MNLSGSKSSLKNKGKRNIIRFSMQPFILGIISR